LIWEKGDPRHLPEKDRLVQSDFRRMERRASDRFDLLGEVAATASSVVMCSNDAFRVLARLREGYTRSRRASVLIAVTTMACGERTDLVSNRQPSDDASDAEAVDAPSLAPDAVSFDASTQDDISNVGADAVDAPAPALCVRLGDPDRPVKVLDLSTEVRNGYLTLLSSDCRWDGLFPNRSAVLAEWSNRLYDWNLDVWGCTDRAPNGFALVPSDVVDLTSSDADLLIDLYIATATRALQLSSTEMTGMRRQLELLAGSVARLSEEHPFSRCDASTDADAGEGGD